MKNIIKNRKQKSPIILPDLSEVQRISFCWFLTEGLPEELTNCPSILNQNSGIELIIYGQEYKIYYPGFALLNALTKKGNYNLRIYVLMSLKKNEIIKKGIVQPEDFSRKERVFFGEIPLLTEKGTFIFNGCERVIISQIIRSPGVYYKQIIKEKKIFYEGTIISKYGSWLTFELEYNLIWVKFDKQYKIPINWFLVGLSLEESEVYQTVQNFNFLIKSLSAIRLAIFDKMTSKSEKNKVVDKENHEAYNRNILLTVFRVQELINQRLLDKGVYDLGEVGRIKLNKKLDIGLPLSRRTLTSLDILKVIDKLIHISFHNEKLDDIDNLENRRVRSVGELLQLQVRVALGRIKKKINTDEKLTAEMFRIKKNKKRAGMKNSTPKKNKSTKKNQLGRKKKPQKETLMPNELLNSKVLTSVIREFFGLSPLSQYFDEVNALAQLTHKRRISSLGPGGLNSEHVSFAARDIHPTQYGRLCPIETPEGQKAGLIASLATHARINNYGFITTPFFRVYKGKVLYELGPVYLTAEQEATYNVASGDVLLTRDNFFRTKIVPVRSFNEFITVDAINVNFLAVSPIQILAVGASLIPFLEHDDANRALMGSNMQRQAVPLLYPKKPIIGTGIEHQIAADSQVVLINLLDGIIDSVCSDRITIIDNKYLGSSKMYFLDKYRRSNQETIINQKPLIWNGEIVEPGQIIADGPGTEGGELALGQNLTVAYMPWDGYNFEDAILVSDRLVQDDLFTSIHIEKYELQLMDESDTIEEITTSIPNIEEEEIINLDMNGIIKKGTFVNGGDILVGKITPILEEDELPESKLLRAIFNIESPEPEDSSLRVPNGVSGRVIEIQTASREKGDNLGSGIYEWVCISIAQIKKIRIGDKLSGRHGNKGVISKIIPTDDMPFLPDGTIVDVILNPLGVPSRMNVGQIFECLLGFAGDYLNRRFKVIPFDEMYKPNASRILINKALKKAAKETDKCWLFNKFSPGKVLLTDGRTGDVFDNSVLVGKPYILKLIHLVDKKMHARSTGSYSLVTQQPLGGKSKHGGQRFGEMEVWALEAFGVAYTLQELLTIKSDDINGRHEVFTAIIKGHNIPEPGIPESFNVLLRELNALGLDMTTHEIGKLNNSEITSYKVNLLTLMKPKVV
uniref:DNA-directed RNA polymerase subunit beta n=1 Tax=Ectocarpus siliculosus TaxID=2880 RepID=D1J787_ECTSI|nr:Plastid-encoded DNA-directed RNA polymerase subunit beta [Ectocarpus siliculosus]CAT18810.1 Plastid-encoded DNA-directed RNA polymerase subunit beta [Ectocarpus siliculosus]CAV31271.1 Plastid-encoded DNA-directed RNA polymerase subunit beta [Ectocarpus siliculosus]